MYKMTNREIKYELSECLATTQHATSKSTGTDKVAMELVEERLIKLINYFKVLHKKEVEGVDNDINNILNP